MQIVITEDTIMSVKLIKRNGIVTWDEMAYWLMKKLESNQEITVLWSFPVL